MLHPSSSISNLRLDAPPELFAAQVVILDDEPVNLVLLDRMLQQTGFCAPLTFTKPHEALEYCTASPPDLLILDLMMPGMDGLTFMKTVREKWGPEERVPILILTADASRDTYYHSLYTGANDFLKKPVDRLELLLRVRQLLETRLLTKELREANRTLEERVLARSRELENAQIEALEKLAQAAEFRDDDTGEHTRRVGNLAARVALQLGGSGTTAALLSRAAPLHDVGKIAIPDSILLKPGKLTAEEFETMKTHTQIGAALLSNSSSPLMKCAETIAISHHEKWGGGGYPCRLKGEEIPIEGRIVAVVDVFDALTNERPYKKAWSVEEALAEIERGKGAHFDPGVVEAFIKVV